MVQKWNPVVCFTLSLVCVLKRLTGFPQHIQWLLWSPDYHKSVCLSVYCLSLLGWWKRDKGNQSLWSIQTMMWIFFYLQLLWTWRFWLLVTLIFMLTSRWISILNMLVLQTLNFQKFVLGQSVHPSLPRCFIRFTNLNYLPLPLYSW